MNTIKLHDTEFLNLIETKLAILTPNGYFILADEWNITYADNGEENLYYSYKTIKSNTTIIEHVVHTGSSILTHMRFW